ncbi:MAG: heavy metal translocating P-type ATPase [Dehalococcoidia bacterium]
MSQLPLMHDKHLPLEPIHCLACGKTLERTLRAVPGVVEAAVSFAHDEATVRLDPHHGDPATIDLATRTCGCSPRGDESTPAIDHLAHRIASLPVTMGTKHDRMQYEAVALGALDAPPPGPHAGHHMSSAPAGSPTGGHAGHDMSDPAMAASMERDIRLRFFVALFLTIPAVLYSPIGHQFVRLPTGGLDPNWFVFALTTPVVWWCGWMFIGGAYWSLRSRLLNMSVLVATGVLAAYLASLLLIVLGAGESFFEAAAMLVTFVLFGHWMEMKSRRGTTDAIRSLFALMPPEATILRNGEEVTIPAGEIVVGDLVVLKPGGRAPVDGVVERGETSMDEALITGESVPVDKNAGDPIVSGSLNRGGMVVVRATSVGEESTVGRIAALVQQAQASKAPGQRLADRAAGYLVVVAVGAGLVTFVVWLMVGAPWLVALTFAISAIVIACPDALGLATPTAVAVGIGLGARRQILIKDAETLEKMAEIRTVAFDKTGTLTEGRPRLTGVETLVGDPDALLRLLAAAERGSEHPIARAILEGAIDRQLAFPDPTDFQATAGRGLAATVDGRAVLAGSRRFLAEKGVDPTSIDPLAKRLGAGGGTLVWVALDGKPAGIVVVADTLKPSAKAAVDLLRSLGVDPVLISGDTRAAAESVGRQVGITRVIAETLPADKAALVHQLGEAGPVAMVGDGVNDAPALAQADVGIAIGAGADVAIETAKVVLMRSDPVDVGRAFLLSKATVRKEKENLVWASVYNLLAIPVAAGVLYPQWGIMLRPEWAALLMSVSSIIVAINALLLRRVDGDLARGGTE